MITRLSHESDLIRVIVKSAVADLYVFFVVFDKHSFATYFMCVLRISRFVGDRKSVV